MNVLDLFSGIGGFSLGLERAGLRTVAFCEIDPYCRAVLAKHWPDVPCYDDVRTLTAARLAADGIVSAVPDACRDGLQTGGEPGLRRQRVGEGKLARHQRGIDVICGGFPCQDISTAGKGAGITGARSGLWSHYARIIGEIRPRYVIVENVAALLGRGLERVLGDLAALGYDAEWHCIPAAAVGAPHRRDRVWIIAYPNGIGGSPWPGDADERPRRRHTDGSGVGADVADADEPRQQIGAMLAGILCGEGKGHEGQVAAVGGWWLVEPDVGRVAHGVPGRVDRLRALGNAVVPQIAEIIGRAINAKEKV